MLFDKWTSDDVTFADATNPVTTFVMPANAVTVKATYKEKPKFKVTVVNGTADPAEAKEGDTVTITANPKDGDTFRLWLSDDITTYDSAVQSPTTFTMIGRAVTITATYKGDVSIQQVLDAAKLQIDGNAVTVSLEAGESASIYSAAGILVKQSAETATFVLDSGLYIIKVGNAVGKVLIK